MQLQLCELCMFLFVNVMDELSRQLFFQFFLIYEIFFWFCFVCHHELNVFYHHFSFSFTDFRFFFSSKKSSYSNCNFGLHSTYFLLFCLLPTQTLNENLLPFSFKVGSSSKFDHQMTTLCLVAAPPSEWIRNYNLQYTIKSKFNENYFVFLIRIFALFLLLF